jgi:hypothetical protein
MQASLITPAKDTYKIKNWKAYNQSLCNRGRITLWIEDSVMRSWRDIDINKKVVGEQTYPDSVILCCLILRMQYDQPLRQTSGFVGSLLFLMGKSHYAIPDYSTLCRRQNSLPVALTKRWERSENIHIAIDSTGLKVYGEGEWKVRAHGVSKRRTWRKLHIGIDINTQEIISVSLTGNDEDDAAVAQKMVEGKTEKIKSFRGDGAYDDFSLREKLGASIEQIIPPPKDAVIHHHTKKKPLPDYLIQRNQAVESINQIGRKEWKIDSGYHKRSLNETVMFRYKTTFGGQMANRKMEHQKTEVNIKCLILNTYRRQAMPLAYKVA